MLVVLPAGLLFGVIGKTFEPDVDEGGFLVTFKTPLGSSLEYSEQRMREIEALLKRQPEVRDYWSAVGIGPLGQVSQGMVFVRLVPAEQRVGASVRGDRAVCRRSWRTFPASRPSPGACRRCRARVASRCSSCCAGWT